MIYRIGDALPFETQFVVTATKLGATGLTVNVLVKRFEINGAVTVLVASTAVGVVEIGKGGYGYWGDSSLNTAYGAVVAFFTTADTTVTQLELNTGHLIAPANDNIDAAISTRLAPIVAGRDLAVNADGTVSASLSAADLAILIAEIDRIQTAVGSSFTRLAGVERASTIRVVQGDTLAEPLTLASFAWATGGKLKLSVKDAQTYRTSTSDADSILQWLLTYGGSVDDGLTYLKNEAAGANRTKGSLAVVDDGNGQVTLNLDKAISLLLQGAYVWDIKHYSAAGDVTTLGGGTIVIEPTITYSIT